MERKHKDRMRKLAHGLRDYVQDDWFDIRSWWSKRRSRSGQGYEAFKARECNTTACAMGWAPTFLPKLVSFDDDHWSVEGVGQDPFTNDGFSVAEKVFGIESFQSRFLFSGEDYAGCRGNPSRLRVATRMEAFIRYDGDIEQVLASE